MTGRRLDYRAVALGAVFQAGAMLVVVLADLPASAIVPTLVVGGLAAGAASRNFEREVFDGVVAGVAGTALAALGVLVGTTVTPWGSAGKEIGDNALVAGMFWLYLLIVAIPLVAIGGAIAGHVGATARQVAPIE